MKVKFITLVFKNVVRNMRRTTFTALVMVFGCVALILAGGFMRYSFWGLSESAIRGQYGHLQVVHPASLVEEEDTPLQYGLCQTDSLIRLIEAHEEVRFAMPRIQFMGLISNGDKSVAFFARAVVPEKEQKLANFQENMESGHHLGEDFFNKDEDEVILASGVAKSLKAGVGDYMTIMTTTTTGALNAVDVKVVGIFSTGIPEMDARFLMVNLATAQSLLRSDRASNVVVVLRETDATDRVHEALSAGLGDLTVRKWYDMAGFYRAVVRLYNAIFGFLGAIIFVVVLLAASNTMMMSIFERTTEIGTMMALGTSGKRVLSQFVLEGMCIGLLAAALGVLSGLTFSFLINHAGIMMPAPPGSSSGYPLNVHYSPDVYVGTFLFIVATSTLSSLIPAMKASRMRIVDALGHV